ncbi:EutN/CcmL family microcompartment protein [bacterium AH-315-I18]|nr:EutN/CcmL family microcompartment protein [bacterium AH-315-I18]
MQIAQVIGRATSTVRHESMAGVKLLVCELLGNQMQGVGDPVLVVDRLGAGTGDRVMLTSDGKGIRDLLSSDNSPVRWWTLGIVD